jgi:S-DNA-T family DNA segregation ATPase FtsK/SpoIIIE
MQKNDRDLIDEQRQKLEKTLNDFKIEARVVSISCGPSVTRYEVEPAPGVPVKKISALSNDIALSLAAHAVRIEAPVPGKSVVGIEIPNAERQVVNLSTIIQSTDFYKDPSPLLACLGMGISGDPVIVNLTRMPHLLIAGATGSGKSVCVNAIICSILMRARPDDVRFLMIDPKMVELSIYNDIPHLLAPVVTDPSKASATLKHWAIKEMERRYEEFSAVGAKNGNWTTVISAAVLIH